MQTAPFDFAEKAATLKALSLTLDSEYSPATRVFWLTLSALHSAYGSLAGAANKLEKAPQHDQDVFNLIRKVVDEIAAVEKLVADIDIEKVRTNAAYAGSMLDRARLARASAEAVDQLAIAISAVLKAKGAVTDAATLRTKFVDTPPKKYAVVKKSFTHTKGGSPVQFHEGQHCQIDYEDADGKRIADGTGTYAVYFSAEEVPNFFDIV
jgi:hypothetical protein